MTREIPRGEIRRICGEIYEGNRIEAIRRYQQASGKGLKESRDFIEALTARLQEETPDKFQISAVGTGCVIFFALAIPLGSAAALVFALVAN